jgi:hypothetical protein
MAKAGATANAFGLDMDQLNAIIGTVTAATKQSGNEVGNFVKSVLPRLLGQPAQDAMKMLNVQFIDQNTGDMRNAVDLYSEIAEKVKHISTVEKAAVMEGLAGKYHISRMTALLDNWHLFEKMLTDSKDSLGSASRENDQYMKSLQARINLMKQSFEELALSMGEAFITEGFIQSMKGLKTVAEGVTWLVKNLGGLPLIMGLITTSTMLMSTTFRTQVKLMAAETHMFGRALTAVGITSKALRATLISTGIGAVIVGISFGVEALLKSMGKARERLEEFERKTKDLTESYKASKNEVGVLAEEYERLSEVVSKQDYKLEDLQEFNSVRNELARLMPELVVGEDQYGNKILGSSEKIRSQIDLLEKQIAVQEKLDAIKNRTEAKENYDSSKDLIKDTENAMEMILTGTNIDDYGITKIEDAIKKYEEILAKQADGKKVSSFEKGMFKDLEKVVEKYQMLGGELETAKMSHRLSAMEMIKANQALGANSNKITNGIINDFTLFVAESEMTSGKVSKAFDNTLLALNSGEFNGILKDYSDAVVKFQDNLDGNWSADHFEEYKENVKSSFEELRNSLIKLLPKGTSDKIVDEIATSLTHSGNAAVMASIDFDKLSKSTGKTKEELKAALAFAPTEEIADLGDATSGAADGADELRSAIERLLGVSESQLTQAKEAIGVYQLLSKAEKLSANSSNELASAVGYLSELYPHLVKGKEINIEAMQNEIKASEVLKQAFELLAQGKITQEQAMLLATAQASKNRIDILKSELEFLQKIVDKFNEIAQQIKDANAKDKLVLNEDNKITDALQDKINAMDRINKIKVDLDVETGSYKKAIDDLAKGIDFTGYLTPDKPKQEDKKKERETRNTSSRRDAPVSLYTSSKYEKEQTKYNDQLDASEHKLSKLKDTSEAYRKELEKQKPILKNLMTVNDAEQKRLAERNQKISNIISGMGDPTKLNNEKKGLYNELKKEFDDNEKTISSLTSNNRDFQSSLDQINTDIAQSKLAELAEVQEKVAKKIEQVQKNFAATQSKFDKQIIDSQRRQSMYEVGSKDWEAELKLQNDIHKKKMEFTILEREELKKALRTENLSAEEKANLKKKVDELSISYGELTDAIRDNEQTLAEAKAEMADKVIETVKKAIETERDLKLAAIDDEIDALEKAYQKKVALLDKEEAARDHNKELSKMQKEQLSLQTQISRLSLDDSQEAKVKRLELQKQLAELMEQIDEKNHDRSIELQKESLQDSYDNEKESLDDKRKLTDRHYSELLNNEERFAALREEIIHDNLANIQIELNNFLDEFAKYNEDITKEIDASWQNVVNSINAVQDAQASLGLEVGRNTPTPSTNTGNTGNTGSTGGNTTSNKGNLITGTFKDGLKASELADILQLQYGAEKANVSSDNGGFRVNAEFENLKRAEDVLKRIIERKLIATGRVFHEGGIVGGKGSRLAELANKMFNDSNGMLIKSLPGELQIPPKNIPNIFSSISGMISGLIPKQTATSGGMSFENLVHIENFNGTRAEIDNLGNALVNKLKNKGVL